MGNIIYSDQMVYTVFGAKEENGETWLLIYLSGAWQWVSAYDCMPHYTSIPMINGTA